MFTSFILKNLDFFRVCRHVVFVNLCVSATISYHYNIHKIITFGEYSMKVSKNVQKSLDTSLNTNNLYVRYK